jgi:hypothetical protein
VVREAHGRDLERVKRYNQEIWPKVHVARLAQVRKGEGGFEGGGEGEGGRDYAPSHCRREKGK